MKKTQKSNQHLQKNTARCPLTLPFRFPLGFSSWNIFKKLQKALPCLEADFRKQVLSLQHFVSTTFTHVCTALSLEIQPNVLKAFVFRNFCTCLRTSANFVSFFRTDVDEVLSEFPDFSVSVLSYQRWIINLRIGKFSNFNAYFYIKHTFNV